MLNRLSLYIPNLLAGLSRVPSYIWPAFINFWRGRWWHKLVVIIIGVILFCLTGMYGNAYWYQQAHKDKPLSLGVTFVADYAQYLGVDPQETMDALINDVGVKRFRLVSYWNKIEPVQGSYDFTELDWQFQKAEAANAHIALSIGIRQPRWPECHAPDWVTPQPSDQQQKLLEQFMTAVITRYKDSSSLTSYELENEALLKDFGTCTDLNRERLVQEFNLVKKLDPKHPIIMSKSNNLPLLATGAPQADEVGMSIYRRVWDGNFTKNYFTYPLPSWYFSFMAGAQQIVTGRETMVHELQAEPWPPGGKGITDVSLDEQNKTFDANRFKNTVSYGKTTGIRTIDLWGAEYWYYRKQILNDDSVWNIAKNTFQNR